MKKLCIILCMLMAKPALVSAKENKLANLGDFFQIYLLKPQKRSSQDKVFVKTLPDGSTLAEISYWRSIKSRDPATVICQAYEWFIFGRGSYGQGVEKAFDKHSSLGQINFRFFDVNFSTKLGKKKGEVLPKQQVVPYLKIGMKRSSLARKKFDYKNIKKMLKRGQCAPVGKQYFDVTWFDEGYIRKGQ